MKFQVPEFFADVVPSAGHGGEDHLKTNGDCPSHLSHGRTELLELQWRDGRPVEEPVHDTAAGSASLPEGEKKAEEETTRAAAGEAVVDWWKLWREGECGGSAAATAHGFPQVEASSSVNVKGTAAAGVGPEEMLATTADEAAEEEWWRLWREGQGSSTRGYPQDSACKNSLSKDEDSLLPSSAASEGGRGTRMPSSDQIDQQCTTLDHVIEHMKSLQQQIQVLSTSSGYCMQPLLFPCICGQAPHPAVLATPAAAAAPPLYLPPPPPAAAAVAPLYPALQPPAAPPSYPAADLNQIMSAVGGPPLAPGGEIGSIGISCGSAEEMAQSTSQIPFGRCARCSFRRRAG